MNAPLKLVKPESSDPEVYSCTFPDCATKGVAKRMFNLPVRRGEKPRAICERHAELLQKEARAAGKEIKLYRLEGTLAFLRRQADEHRTALDLLEEYAENGRGRPGTLGAAIGRERRGGHRGDKSGRK